MAAVSAIQLITRAVRATDGVREGWIHTLFNSYMR
jgi:hypothetical protein